MYLNKKDRLYTSSLCFIFILAAIAFGVAWYLYANNVAYSTSTYQFLVSLPTQVYPKYINTTELFLFDNIPLISTITQPSGFAPVTHLFASFIIYALPEPTLAYMIVEGTVFFQDTSTLQFQGESVRYITIDSTGLILSTTLVSTNIAVIGGTNSYSGAYGSWLSDQNTATTTIVTTTIHIPILP